MKRTLLALALLLAAAAGLPVVMAPAPAPASQLRQHLLALCRERGVDCTRVRLSRERERADMSDEY